VLIFVTRHCCWVSERYVSKSPVCRLSVTATGFSVTWLLDKLNWGLSRPAATGASTRIADLGALFPHSISTTGLGVGLPQRPPLSQRYGDVSKQPSPQRVYNSPEGTSSSNSAGLAARRCLTARVCLHAGGTADLFRLGGKQDRISEGKLERCHHLFRARLVLEKVRGPDVRLVRPAAGIDFQ